MNPAEPMDPAATPLQRAVEVIDRLRSPGGCPWDAEQTHESLVRYLVEECYEVIEAIETGNQALLREELGDLLLQVLFHARIAREDPAGFGIDEVAGDLVDKLVRRHPHVFAGAHAGSAADLNETWERQKIAEKGRTSAVDGVPIDQPALALTAKLVARARRHQVDVDVDAVGAGDADGIGAQLFAVVRVAVAAGLDPETELRRTARAYRAAVVAAEAQTGAEAQTVRTRQARPVELGGRDLPGGPCQH
jgi:XTP/dITP diphosphohydrolase